MRVAPPSGCLRVGGRRRRWARPCRSLVPALLLAACLSAACPSGASAQAATEDMVNEALPKLEAYVGGLIDGGTVPGMAIAIVYKGQLV